MVISRPCFRDTDRFDKGDTSQRLAAAFLMRHGWYVIPSYDYHAGDTKAPRMQGRRDGFVLPDLDVARGAVRRWVEVKYKRSASFTYKTKQLEHGIERRVLRDYLRVEQETGCELWLAIHEGVTDKLLVRRVSDLLPFAREWGADTAGARPGYQGAMTYFPRKQFQYLATVPIPEPAHDFIELRYLVGWAPDAVSRHLAGEHVPYLRAWQRALLSCRTGPDDALTLLEASDLLPWFGKVEAQ